MNIINNAIASLEAARIKVIHGATDGVFGLAGAKVSTVQFSLVDAFNIPPDAISFVNGSQVEPTYILMPNDTLEFVKKSGEKSSLDPDEKAQLDRIESMLNQLFVKPADHGSPGRSVETLEIATSINQFRQQGLTWKEVLKACRERWPNDPHVNERRANQGDLSAVLQTEPYKTGLIANPFCVHPRGHGSICSW